jgi:hypothetical protein
MPRIVGPEGPPGPSPPPTALRAALGPFSLSERYKTSATQARVFPLIAKRRYPVLNSWSRAEHCREMALECRRLAETTLSEQMKRRYLLMAKDYRLLTDVEEQEHAYCGRRQLQEMPRTPERLP